MGDLEELFFTRNLPGKYSRWAEEDDDLNNDDDEELAFAKEEGGDADPPPPHHLDDVYSESATRLLDADIPDEVRQSILDERGKKHKTGVKGVLADHKQSQALKKAQREANAVQRSNILTLIAEGAKVSTNNEFSDEEDVINDDEDSDDISDSEDAFMREFRAKRLKELKSQQAIPVFGHVREIQDCDFISEVEKEDPRVYVIVHLYDTTTLACVRMNRILEEIAMNSKDVKFLRMNVLSSCIEVDRIALPILTIYKGGESVEVLAGITVELGDYFKKEDIEWLIENHIANK